MNIESDLIKQLRQSTLFENVSDVHFMGVKGKLMERRFKANDVIFEEQTEGGALFLIAHGRVELSKRNSDGADYRLALLHPGDFFGELELVDGRPRSARAVALEDGVMFALQKKDFEHLLIESHPFAVRLMQVLSLRLRSLSHNFVQEIQRSADRFRGEVKRFDQIIDAAKIVNSTLDLERLLSIILETALRVVNGDRGTVYLIDTAKRELWSKVLKGDEHIEIRLPLGTGIAGHVATSGDIVNISDAYNDPRFNAEFDRKAGYHTTTVLCMPMRNKDKKIIGVVQLLNKKGGEFTDADVNFIDALSVHASIAIENARLYEQERQKLRMEKELFAAREVQMSLVPQQLPQIPEFEFAGYTMPAREVGGDYFDFIRIDEHLLAVSLGDVSGKGLPAALLMANAQATVRGQSLSTRSARECLERSNRFLFQSSASDKFVTLFYAILDTQNHQLLFSNAGHEHPFLFSAAKEPLRLSTGGIMLGIIDDVPFQEEMVPFEPGGTLVVFSDGITEAMNETKEQYGEARLAHVVRKHITESPADLVERIIHSVTSYVGSAPQMDDMTLVVIKRKKE